MPSTPAWLAAAEAMLNRGIDSSSQAMQLARRLNSTSLQLDVQGVMQVRASVHDGHLGFFAADGSVADAVISGSVPGLLSLLGAARPAARERAAVAIAGDAEIANLYRQLFAAARPDPEEELSRWIGDAPARGISRVAGKLIGWSRRTQRIVGENIAEYLQEESRDLVSRPEVEEFLQGVDLVREAADRMEARLQILQRQLKGDP